MGLIVLNPRKFSPYMERISMLIPMLLAVQFQRALQVFPSGLMITKGQECAAERHPNRRFGRRLTVKAAFDSLRSAVEDSG